MPDTIEVLVGVIGRPHGVRGEVTVDLRTDEPERRFAPGQVLRTEDGPNAYTVTGTRAAGGRFLVTFREIGDRAAAESVRGVRLVVDVDPALPPEVDGEYYDRQLVGLAVLDHHGELQGRVDGVIHLAAQDLLEVATPEGSRLIPFVAALVPEVDLESGHLRVADVPGLLSDDETG